MAYFRQNKYTPEKIAGKMNSQASKASGETMLVSGENVMTIVQTMRYHDRDLLKLLMPRLRFAYKSAKYHDDKYLSLMKMAKPEIFISAIEAQGHSKEHYEFMKEIIRWFGVVREPCLKFNKWIPADERDGSYSNEYDGTPWNEQIAQTEFLDTTEEKSKEEFYRMQMAI